MSAFQAYAGAYEFNGSSYSWRCYATARVYDMRKQDHGPFPPAPKGKKWLAVDDRRLTEQALSWLIDENTADFSQILVQVESRAAAHAQRLEPVTA